MATSGSTDFSINARQLIQYALEKINIVAEGQSMSDTAAEKGRIELNLLLHSWQKHPALWRTSEGYVGLIANTPAIALTPRPYRVLDCRFRQTTGIDIPMVELTKQEYMDLPNKTTTGIPTQWYFEPQRDSSNLYAWPVLSSVTTETVRVTYQRRFEDIDDLANDIDITQEHLDTVRMNLAARLADSYGRAGPHIDRIIQRSESLREEMEDCDRPETLRFVPETRYG